jgi:hypothetical protein
MRRLLPAAGHAVNHLWEAGAVLAAWNWKSALKVATMAAGPGRA